LLKRQANPCFLPAYHIKVDSLEVPIGDDGVGQSFARVFDNSQLGALYILNPWEKWCTACLELALCWQAVPVLFATARGWVAAEPLKAWRNGGLDCWRRDFCCVARLQGVRRTGSLESFGFVAGGPERIGCTLGAAAG